MCEMIDLEKINVLIYWLISKIVVIPIYKCNLLWYHIIQKSKKNCYYIQVLCIPEYKGSQKCYSGISWFIPSVSILLSTGYA